MKIITSQNFELRHPDPGLGLGATEQDVANSAGLGGNPNVSNQQGFLEANIDWDALMESHVGLGYWDTLAMAAIEGVVPVELYYTFDYNFEDSMGYSPSNINITQAVVSFGGQKIIISQESRKSMDADLLYRFKEDYEDVILEDIKVDAADRSLPQM